MLLWFGMVLTGCHPNEADVRATFARVFGDSPTSFVQLGPIQIATSGDSVIFKSPTESNNCVLYGGTVSLTAASARPPLRAPVRFSYSHTRATVRTDVLRISAAAGGLAINGRGQYRFEVAGAPWRPLGAVPVHGIEHRADGGVNYTIQPIRDGAYRIALAAALGGTQRRIIFTGSVLPYDGVVYVRDAVLSNVATSYVGRSQHDCGNWDTAGEAATALGRVQAHWPTPQPVPAHDALAPAIRDETSRVAYAR